jgi:hypothetical protein
VSRARGYRRVPDRFGLISAVNDGGTIRNGVVQ